MTRCPYGINSSVQKAKKAGATDEQIAETICVGIAMFAGAAVAHCCIAVDCMKK